MQGEDRTQGEDRMQGEDRTQGEDRMQGQDRTHGEDRTQGEDRSQATCVVQRGLTPLASDCRPSGVSPLDAYLLSSSGVAGS